MSFLHRGRQFTRSLACVGIVCILLAGAGCREKQATGPTIIRLHDILTPADVKGRLTQGDLKIERTAWRFDGSEAAAFVTNNAAATFGWQAGPGSSALEIRGGRLTGQATNSFPIIHIERPAGPNDLDPLQAIEIRMRASAGTNLSLRLMGPGPLDFPAILEEAAAWPWITRTTLKPGGEFQTYVLTPQIFETTAKIRRILLNPTDATDAAFEIESVRLIFRREHLAEIDSGGGWHGLGEIHHETIVARTPERIEIPLKLPASPRFDLSIGTVQEGAVQFEIAIRPQAGATTADQVLLRRTVTTPHRWEPLQIDLARYAGQSVTLSLALVGNPSGQLGFWGSPVIWDMAAARAASNKSAGPPQGVILIWADTTRWDHLNFYGYARETAPVLGTMAAEGTLFQHCISQATWTKVATPSLFTSLYPLSHTVHQVPDRLPASAHTLAEVFRQHGYATVSFSALPFTGKASNLHQGFQELHEGASLIDTPREGKNAREFVSRALPWLDRHRELPFFMFLHLFDAHDPFEPMPPYNTLWAKPGDGETYERMLKKVKPLIEEPQRRNFGKGMPNQAEVRKAGEDPQAYIDIEKNWYDGSIRGMDTEIGRLRERLAELGLTERVLIVFASDHGEEFFDHGAKLHGHTTYAELSHVALFISWPGSIPKGRTIPATVRTIDIMPTLLELCQIEPPAGVQGQSLVPLILEGQGSSRLRARGTWKPAPAITEKAIDPDLSAKTESYAIVVDQWKLIHNVLRLPAQPEYELFEWAKDPLDQKNVAAEHPEVVKRLATQLGEWKAMALAAKLPADDTLTKGMSDQEIQRLRSLGYLK